nr:immunoglobulin light chain junction region [Macaca mulatta]
CGQGTHIPFTF